VAKRSRIGLRHVRVLRPGETIWDSSLSGFGARRQKSDAVSYVLFYRTREGRQRWFIIGRHAVVGAAFNQAATLAEKVAPYRHPRLATMRLSGDQTAQEIPDDMTAEELRAEILSDIVRFGILPPQLAELLPERQRLLEPGIVVHRGGSGRGTEPQ
jgi:hypothetical protein